ncbi:DNA polymerase III subunit delta [Flavisolibacter nicotianae]|uniref:DNA polymerase III subunit delta n=1 Tax=Flavisolibacter nicotianae TaxID=2364882 RepID=UPI000EB0E5DD|nr:DNA polymerase III subunit delta [Flavisolibacter nicotianae]
MTPEKIISDIKKGQFRPVYWLEGEEDFFIDQVIQFAEHKILPESEAGFNLTIFYGRDAAWADVVNACRRYPMFAEKQVVIIKEAQDLKGIEKLEAYVEKPLSSTLLFVAYKGKKVDGRTKLAKLLKEKAVLFTSKKIYDSALPDWTSELVTAKGFSITKKALFLLIDHIGNDLSRLSNEIDKLALNLKNREKITEDDIEQFVGVSKEFNVFELQQAIAQRDLYKAVRIVNYFGSNPKAAPIQLIFPSLYNFFSKVQVVYSVPAKDERSVATALGVNSFFVKDYVSTATRFSYPEIEKILLLLYEYNLRNLGVNDAGTDDAELLKEMVVKMIAPL